MAITNPKYDITKSINIEIQGFFILSNPNKLYLLEYNQETNNSYLILDGVKSI